MFVWGSEGRLRPMRMVWLDRNHHYHRFEIAKWERREMRAWSRDLRREPKVENDREMRQRYPGRTGDWPRHRKARPLRHGESTR